MVCLGTEQLWNLEQLSQQEDCFTIKQLHHFCLYAGTQFGLILLMALSPRHMQLCPSKSCVQQDLMTAHLQSSSDDLWQLHKERQNIYKQYRVSKNSIVILFKKYIKSPVNWISFLYPALSLSRNCQNVSCMTVGLIQTTWTLSLMAHLCL